ncbi:MAG: hypothetical protein ACI89D_001884 [Bermanella sp.]|jgi:hypothetical protein
MSFLDAMSCGLGAVILIFMIINHASEVRAVGSHRDVAQNLSLLEQEVLQKRSALTALASALQETKLQLEAARREAASLEDVIDQEDDSDQEVRTREKNIQALKEELKSIEKQVNTFREKQGDGDATRSFVGEGRRQYLTGLKVDGKHVLILVDASASMLADTILDVIRRRNMSEVRKSASAKWQRAVNTVDWLTTQVPSDSQFQLYSFNTSIKAALPGTEGKWLGTDKGRRLTDAVQNLRKIVPANGTSLELAFQAVAALQPAPDAVFLITDGLPTQDVSGSQTGGVSGRERIRLFGTAVSRLPKSVPVNVILFPMEGDPLAASSFWQLARSTGGVFMSPSEDWP